MKTKISQAFLKKGQLVSLRLEPEYLAVGVANEYVGSCLSNCDSGDFDTRCVPQNDRIDSGFICESTTVPSWKPCQDPVFIRGSLEHS